MNKALRLILATLLGWLLFQFTANSQCTGNLLTNPGFESGLTGWTTVGNISISSDAHSGSKGAKGTGSSYMSVGQALLATPGMTYSYTVWSKGLPWIQIRFLNANWQSIQSGSVAIPNSPSIYQASTYSLEAPAGSVYVYLLISMDQGSSFTVDDACLTAGGGGSSCAITPSVSNIVCSNNNTPSNPNDDTYSFTVNATNPVAGTGYQMVIPQLSQTYNGTYGSQLFIQNVPIATGNLTLNFMDNMTANCSATATVTAPPPCSVTGQPDLSGSIQEIIPGTNNCFTSPGQSFGYMSMMIVNSGDVAATAFKVKFYFSTDNVLSANDVLWSTVNVPSLNIMSNGGPAFISPDQPVPASLANGQYYVIVQIDTDNQVTESNEANNTIPPFTVQIGAPDVTLDSYSGIPATVAAGSSFNIQVTVKYLANGFTLPTSTSFPVNVYISDISPNIALGSVNYTLADFNQSNTVTKTVQVTVPPSVPTGSHPIRMYANTSFCEDVYLSNYKDQSVTVTSGGGSGIDLELSMVQNTANPVIYSNYTTTLTLVNKGPQVATGVKVKWMKPAGVVYTGGNEFVASQGSFNPNGDQVWTVGSVPANGTATLRVSYFLLQNGAPITYAQVSAANETDVDSQPNNGAPPTPVQDDEANSGGTAPPVLTPDLTISNLVFANGPGTPGQILAYYFDLANIGNGNAPQDFIVRAWISTNPTFNTTGIQDGIVPTGNFIAGFSATWVPGASTLPTSLAPGQYYLHLKVDADAQVTESNENNNTVSVPFLVQAAPGQAICDDLVGGGYVECVQNNSLGNLEVFHSSATGYEKATFNAFGEVVSNQPAGAMPVYPSYQIEGGNMEKKLGNTVVYSQPLPTAITSQYNAVLNFTEFNGGFVFFASKTSDPKLFAIRTDGSYNIQSTAVVGSYSYIYGMYVTSAFQVTPTQFAFIYRTPGGEYSSVYYLVVMDASLNTVSSQVLQGQALSSFATMSQNACGQYLIETSYSYIGHRGGTNGKTYRVGHFENGNYITEHSYETSVYTSECSGSAGYGWTLLLPDGNTLRAGYSAEIFLCNVPTVSSAIVTLSKMQGSAILWTKYVSVPFASGILRLAYSGNEVVFLSGKNGAVFATTLTCLEEETDTRADLTIFNPPYNYVPNMVAGGTSSFSFRLYNLGITPANGVEVRAVLSTDQAYSPGDDITIGTLSGLNINTNTYTYLTMNHLVPANTASGSYYYLLVADVGNVVLESNENNNTYASQINVTGGAPPSGCNAVTITPGPSQVTIAGFSAPHVLIKVFRPNWTVAFECLDNCANPLVVNGLPDGTYHLQIKLIDNGWGTICYLERDVAVNSFGGGNGSSIAKQEDRLSLTFEKVYPNPSAYQVFVDLFSPKEQAAKLDFYDIQGRIVHTMNVELDEGVNTIDVMVFDWKSGTYNVIARGEETALPAYGRLMKVWEE
ncbi:MAG: T9SS type A sorting domain-containing protein [Saprospiraceae bacterium]|nr:T9SS type A sorting domain-containing protein [Saprospiraceae bacterium]